LEEISAFHGYDLGGRRLGLNGTTASLAFLTSRLPDGPHSKSYSEIERPSIDPELMIRMLTIGW
jgi:hypothetical protein